MGGHKKNRYKSKNQQNNNNTKSHNSRRVELTEEEIQNLIAQCLQIHQILENNSKTTRQQPICHLLSKKWLQSWKNYVGYADVVKGEMEEGTVPKNMGQRHPGPINQNMRKITKQYRQIPPEMAEYQYLNIVLNDKLDKNDDYIAVCALLWEVLSQKYQVANEIIRPVRKNKSSFFYDAQLTNCEVMFVDYDKLDDIYESQQKLSKRQRDDLLESQKMQFSTIWEFKHLKKFLQEFVKHAYKSEREITIWKAYNYLSFVEIKDHICEITQKQTYKFLGVSLEDPKFEDLDLDEFLTTCYTIVVQINGNRFKQAIAPEDVRGYCEQCVKVKKLDEICQCNEAHYCSMECRVDNQIFHSNFCPITYDSDDDDEYEKKQVKFKPGTFISSGLENLGNTCYMNSSLQLIMSMDQFRDFYATNQYKKHEKQQDKKEIFLKKFSKFCKKIGQSNKTLVPWSLKSQVNKNLTPFRGYRQHDAQDFISHFINLTNEFLQHKEDEMYHPLIKNTLIGQFNSIIQCPDCTIKIESVQPFMSLNLPIKQKGKKVTFGYIVSRAGEIIKGRADSRETWDQVLQLLGVANKEAPIYATRQGEPLYSVNIENSPEKELKSLKGKQMIVFPELVINEGETPLCFMSTATRDVMGNKMKYRYGYPNIVKIDARITSMIGFLIQIAETYKQVELAKVLQKIQGEYNQFHLKMDEQNSKGQGDTKQQQENEKVQDSNANREEAIEKMKTAIKDALEAEGMQICIDDTKRKRGVCNFCHRKCNNCPLPIVFGQSMEQYFGERLDEVRFDITLRDKVEVNVIEQNLSSSGDSTLEDCIELFKMPEQLDQENAWYCQACDMMRLALKQLSIVKFPKLLLIQLSRFKTEGDRKVKNSEPIEYKEIEEFQHRKYRLLSVIVHEGSMDAGHYWAICLRDGKYYIYNDDKVVETEKICNKNAYILLYREIE